jgi:hypothetical protein
VCRFESHALCVDYLDDQANGSTFQEKVHRRRVAAVQQSTRVTDSSMCIKRIINSLQHQEEADQWSKRLATT